MDYIIYLVAYPIIWLLSVLPFRLLYCVSDVLYNVRIAKVPREGGAQEFAYSISV